MLLCLKKGISKKTVLRFVSILFLIFAKGNKQKNCARHFEIHKYAFLIFVKGNVSIRGKGFVSILF